MSTLNREQFNLVNLILSIIEAVRSTPTKAKYSGVFLLPDLFDRIETLIRNYVNEAISEIRDELRAERWSIETQGYNRGVESARAEYNRTMSCASAYGSKLEHHFNNAVIVNALRQERPDKITAIKELRNQTQCGLKEAKDEIERRLLDPKAWGYDYRVVGNADLETFNSPDLANAVKRGLKIEAIRILRTATGAGLKEAKEEIERRQLQPWFWGYEVA